MIKENFYGIDPQTHEDIYIIKDDDKILVEWGKIRPIERNRSDEISAYLKSEFGKDFKFHEGDNHIELKDMKTNEDVFIIEWRFKSRENQ